MPVGPNQNFYRGTIFLKSGKEKKTVNKSIDFFLSGKNVDILHSPAIPFPSHLQVLVDQKCGYESIVVLTQ